MNQVYSALTSLGFDWQIALANLVNFLIIFFILKKFFFGSISETLKSRSSKIEQGLKDAQEAKVALLNAEQEKKNIVSKATQEASDILKNTDIKNQELGLKLELIAKEKAEKIINDAEVKSELILTQTNKDFAKEAPALVVSMVEKLLNEKMTQEDNEKYIKKMLSV